VNRAEIQTLWAYNWWANQRILNKTAELPTRDFLAPAQASFGSLRGTLVHILGAEVLWRRRCQEGISPTRLIKETEFVTSDALLSFWQKEEEVMQGYVGGLQDSDLAATVQYTNTKGIRFENPLWWILYHVINHGTQFRSEAGMLLTNLGHSPGDVDLIFYLRDQPTQ
jgi:uncharacterized damage-inducible protein DinB